MDYTNNLLDTKRKIMLGVTSTGKAIIFSDSAMPILGHYMLNQTFPLPSKLAVKGLIREYRGKYRLAVKNALESALRLF